MIRKFLDGLYAFSGALACAALVAIVLVVLVQIVGRLLGVLVPSTDEFAGYAMAASTFLGLAYTFRANGHIRVNLFVQRLPERRQRSAELLVLVLLSTVTTYFAWYCIDMTYSSYDFGDLSAGLLPVPLWMPQSVMTLGVLLFAVSAIDELIQTIRGHAPTYQNVDQSVLGVD